ncbi:MAG: rhodanese-like domain-containing protein [Rubripirellula sp.]
MTIDFAVADDGDAPRVRRATAGGRSQQRAVLHTADPLPRVLERVNGKKAILLDVREQSEWDAGHLRHAVLLPLSDLKKLKQNPDMQAKVKKLSKDKILYCHCKAGGRVLAATPILRSLGYDIRPLKAGYGDLLKAGFEKAPPSDAKSK